MLSGLCRIFIPQETEPGVTSEAQPSGRAEISVTGRGSLAERVPVAFCLPAPGKVSAGWTQASWGCVFVATIPPAAIAETQEKGMSTTRN